MNLRTFTNTFPIWCTHSACSSTGLCWTERAVSWQPKLRTKDAQWRSALQLMTIYIYKKKMKMNEEERKKVDRNKSHHDSTGVFGLLPVSSCCHGYLISTKNCRCGSRNVHTVGYFFFMHRIFFFCAAWYPKFELLKYSAKKGTKRSQYFHWIDLTVAKTKHIL